MKLHPPPMVNKRVTAEMLQWVVHQPNTVMFNTVTSEFTVTPGKGAQDYVVDNETRAIIIKEFRDILIHNGFGCEYAYRNMLEISKGKWSMRLNLIGQIPFPDYLPHQINKAYEYWKYEQDSLNRTMSYEISMPPYNLYTDPYPSREHLEKVRQMITDSMGVSAELLGNNDSRSDIVREAEDSIDDTNKD